MVLGWYYCSINLLHCFFESDEMRKRYVEERLLYQRLFVTRIISMAYYSICSSISVLPPHKGLEFPECGGSGGGGYL